MIYTKLVYLKFLDQTNSKEIPKSNILSFYEGA